MSLNSIWSKENMPNFCSCLISENSDLSTACRSSSWSSRWHKVQVFTQLTEIKTAVQWSGSVFVQQNMFLIIKGLLRNGCRQLFRLSICPLVCSPSLPGMLTCIFSLPPPFPPSLFLSFFLILLCLSLFCGCKLSFSIRSRTTKNVSFYHHCHTPRTASFH